VTQKYGQQTDSFDKNRPRKIPESQRYIEDKTGMPARNFTTTEIEALLFECSVSKELTCKTVKILNDFDTIRFSREKGILLFKTEIIQDIEQTALELEQELASELEIIPQQNH